MTEALCIVCGLGATRLVAGLGALIALSWSTELGGFRWAHRACAEAAGLLRRELPKPSGGRGNKTRCLSAAGARVTTRDVGRVLMLAIGFTAAVVIGTPIAGVVLLASYRGCVQEGS